MRRTLYWGIVALAAALPPSDDPFARLEHPSSAVRSQARAALAAEGAPAARAALEGFGAASPAARRDRAWLVGRYGEVECIPAVVGILASRSEPDPDVRIELARFLVRGDLGDARIGERADVLAELCTGDAGLAVVRFAIEGLASLRSPEAGAALDRLLDQLPPPHRERAAAALVETARGREAIVRRVSESVAGARVPPDVLGPLLAAYGRVVVDLAGGGESARDVAPLLAGLRHPDDRVRVGARLGIENLISRCTQLLAFERCERVLGALEEAGFDPRDLDYRRAIVALSFSAEPAAAIVPARRMLSAAADLDDDSERSNRFYAAYLEAAALVATGRAELAGPLLDAAAAVLTELVRERVDLEPRFDEPSERRRREAASHSHGLALVELMRATALLLSGHSASDPIVLEILRDTHARLLEAAVLAARWDLSAPTDLDELLDHDLGPRRLLYDNSANPHVRREQGIALLSALGRGFASVAPAEMPGFAPFEGVDTALADPLRDDVRFGILLRLEYANAERYRDRAADPETSQLERRRSLQLWEYSRRNLRRAERELEGGRERAEAYRFLLVQREPSRLALWLARDLRSEGRPRESRALSERMLSDLAAAGSGDSWLEADVGVALASSFTEEDRPSEAEEVLLGVLADLEAVANQLEGIGDLAREEGDLVAEARAAAQVRGTELRIADCLVSLAVNANVKLGDQERALGYFERAFELDKRDFMRGLLACYRARSGRFEEARAELREIAPSPMLYYNMACTYALLSETDLALDYLKRDFDETQQSRSSLARQKAWAATDPDLASLRGDERFQRLVTAE